MQTLFDILTALMLGAVVALTLMQGRQALREWQLLSDLRRRGKPAQARITGQSARRRMGILLSIAPQYYVAFGFMLDGVPYRLEQRVGRKTYRMAQPGTLITVRYLPGAAHVARMDGPYADSTGAFAATVNMVLAVIWTIILWYAFAPGLLWR